MLANTSLALLALARHGDTPWGAPATQEFVSTFRKGLDFLESCVDLREDRLLFRGEEEDTRTFLMAASAVLEVHGLSREKSRHALLEKCVDRLVKDDFPCLSGEIDETRADQLRWLVMDLETARDLHLGSEALEKRLAQARTRLVGHENDDYYGAWLECRRVISEKPDVEARQYMEDAISTARIGYGVEVLSEPVKDESGNLRWAGVVETRAKDERWIKASGLGEIGDTALLALRFAWPGSMRARPNE